MAPRRLKRSALPFDPDATVERLINDVGKLQVPRTDAHLEAALQDLSQVPPWSQSDSGQLARDFLETIEQAGPTLRRTVRLTLGLDESTETLTERREMDSRPKNAGGQAHLLIESYALLRVLYALVANKASMPTEPSEHTLGGFVIREVEVSVVFEKNEESHQVTILADCQRDGEQIFLVPTVGKFDDPVVYESQIWREDKDVCQDIGNPSGSFWIDHTTADYGHYHIVAFYTPCRAGDRVQVDLMQSRRVPRPLSEMSWWSSLGTERLITLHVTAAGSLLEFIQGVARTPEPELIDPTPYDQKSEDEQGSDDTETWSVTKNGLARGHLLELRWQFSEMS
jgi:hypothetical protein